MQKGYIIAAYLYSTRAFYGSEYQGVNLLVQPYYIIIKDSYWLWDLVWC